MDNLRGRMLSGMFWHMLERVGFQLIQFIPTIFLARLLAPAEFGLIGMLALFIALANTFLDSGFSLALIQKKDADYTDECSMFYFNLATGALLTLALWLGAPLIADFYDQPQLTWLTRAISFSTFIRAFDLIQTTQLARALDFKTQLKTTLIGGISSGVAGVTAAYLGMGVWSLVIQRLTDDLVSTAALWLICDWRPARRFSYQSLKSMFAFGSRMLLSSLVSTFFNNLYQAFIGKVFSAASLGYYTRAATMGAIVIDNTSGVLSRVSFPALASIQDDGPRLKRAVRKSVQLVTFLHFPLMIGLSITAPALINVLFTAKWAASVPFLQLMCLSGMLYPLQLINLNILKVKGRSDLYFRLGLVKQGLMVLNLVITYRWGISAMLTGNVVIAILAYFLNSWFSERLIGYSVKEQLRDALPAFLTTALMGGGAFLVGLALVAAGDLVRLLAQAAGGAAIYLLLNWGFKTAALQEGLAVVKGYLKR